MSDTVQAIDNKVYSNDGKIWAGMTKDDAKTKFGNIIGTLLFNQIDKDKNHELSEEEINIYNGPALKYDNRKGNDSYFYPGLELNTLTNENDKELFQKLDTAPKDDVLTENEIREEISIVEEDKERQNKSFDKTLFTTAGITTGIFAIAGAIAGRRGGAGVFGGFLGAIGGFALGGLLGGIIATAKESFEEKNSEFEIETK